jgi:type I site-specific restriction endonuclease
MGLFDFDLTDGKSDDKKPRVIRSEIGDQYSRAISELFMLTSKIQAIGEVLHQKDASTEQLEEAVKLLSGHMTTTFMDLWAELHGVDSQSLMPEQQKVLEKALNDLNTLHNTMSTMYGNFQQVLGSRYRKENQEK